MSPARGVILAFDTSATACDVAVVSDDAVTLHRHEAMRKGQAERLLPFCREVLDDAKIELSALHGLGVGIGPGNFTGIRISVSAARGLALGLGIPAVGVSTFEALSYGVTGRAVASVDARRDQVYIQHFDAGRSSAPPRLIDRSALSGLSDPVIGAGGRAAPHPIAVAIARITQSRYSTPQPRPAPLYLRPADAAPSKDGAPVILS